jgi:hypothetical protein
VFAIVRITEDDEICTEIKKNSFLEATSEWTDKDLTKRNSHIQITEEGDILL